MSSGDEEDWEAALAPWVSDDDADPLTDAAEWVGGIASWVATYSERSKAKSAARAEPPPLTVTALTNEMRREMELGADEAHFLPLEDSGWSIALLRYRPKEGGARRSKQSRAIPAVSVTSMDAAWDDSDFYHATPWRHRDLPPVMMVPGCASNAYTFDVAEGYSLARHLANRGHDTWIVESRGVGFSRPWGETVGVGGSKDEGAAAAHAHVGRFRFRHLPPRGSSVRGWVHRGGHGVQEDSRGGSLDGGHAGGVHGGRGGGLLQGGRAQS